MLIKYGHNCYRILQYCFLEPELGSLFRFVNENTNASTHAKGESVAVSVIFATIIHL